MRAAKRVTAANRKRSPNMTIFTRAVAVETPEQRAKVKPGKGKPIRFLASSAGIKRDGLDLDQNRWFFDNFERNPVFLRFHNYWSNPIGRVSTNVTDRGLEVEVTFDPGDPDAVETERKYRDNYMHAISVGWDNVKRMINREGEVTLDPEQAVETVEGYDLLDVSAVAVPGDPDALIERSKRAMRALYGDEPTGPALTESDREALAALVRETVQETVEQTLESQEGDEGGQQREGGQEAELDLVYAVDPAYFAAEIAWQIEQIRLGRVANDPDGLRAGAVLSKQNLADLKEALAKINAVIARAEKLAEQEGDEGGQGDGGSDDGDDGDGDDGERAFDLKWLSELDSVLPELPAS